MAASRSRRKPRLRPQPAINRVALSGRIVELGALRYTPAGLPAVEFRIAHTSEQDEAGTKRKVSAEIGAIAFDAQARILARAKLDTPVALEGFLAARSRRSKRLVLHVTHIEFIEGA